ncbi:Unknown protein, partial [Striga hermonthica]
AVALIAHQSVHMASSVQTSCLEFTDYSLLIYTCSHDIDIIINVYFSMSSCGAHSRPAPSCPSGSTRALVEPAASCLEEECSTGVLSVVLALDDALGLGDRWSPFDGHRPWRRSKIWWSMKKGIVAEGSSQEVAVKFVLAVVLVVDVVAAAVVFVAVAAAVVAFAVVLSSVGVE